MSSDAIVYVTHASIASGDNNHRPRQKQRAQAHTSLRKLIARVTSTPVSEIAIKYQPNGAPFAVINNHRQGHCSISHSKEKILVGYSQSTIFGLDIEYMKPRSTSDLLQMILTDEEKANTPPNSLQDFYRIFCAKEAWAKANQQSLAQAIATSLNVDPKLTRQVIQNWGVLYLESLANSYSAAIFLAESNAKVEWISAT